MHAGIAWRRSTAITERKARESSPSNANHYLTHPGDPEARRDELGGGWIPSPRAGCTGNRRRPLLSAPPDEAQQASGRAAAQLRDTAQFALATGLRQRNVSYLRWEQVDMARRVTGIHPDQAKLGRPLASH